MSTASQQIARSGERRVFEILEGSAYPNELKESFLPYDLEWEGIKINVKATAQTVAGTDKACSFNFLNHPDHNGVVAVMVALLGNKEYFWVEKVSPNIKTYRRLADGIQADSLPAAIREASKQQTDHITQRTQKFVKFDIDDHEKIADLRQSLKQVLRVDFSLKGAILYAINYTLKNDINLKETKRDART